MMKNLLDIKKEDISKAELVKHKSSIDPESKKKWIESLERHKNANFTNKIKSSVMALAKAADIKLSYFVVIDNMSPNAYIADDVMVIHSSLLKDFYNDMDMIKFIIAHEMAHYYHNHMNKQRSFNALMKAFEAIGVISVIAGGIVANNNDIHIGSIDTYTERAIAGLAALGIIRGGSSISIAKKSQTQEHQADTTAVSLCIKAFGVNFNFEPAIKFFSYLSDSSKETGTRKVRQFLFGTHPISKARIRKIIQKIASFDINVEKYENILLKKKPTTLNDFKKKKK
jgi:Zn-dependent protease with chaperone function